MKNIFSLMITSILIANAHPLWAKSPLFFKSGHAKAANATGNANPIKGCADPEKFLKQNKKARSSYVALMAQLCGWTEISKKMQEAGFDTQKIEEVLRFQILWTEVSKESFSSLPSLSEYQELGLAKDEYYREQGDDAVHISLEPSTALEAFVLSNKFNISQKSNLYYLLKLYDESLVDANISSFSGKIFKQATNSQLSPDMFKLLVELEIDFQKSKKPIGAGLSKKVQPGFRKTPLASYGEAISSSEDQEDAEKLRLLVASEKAINDQISGQDENIKKGFADALKKMRDAATISLEPDSEN